MAARQQKIRQVKNEATRVGVHVITPDASQQTLKTLKTKWPEAHLNRRAVLFWPLRQYAEANFLGCSIKTRNAERTA
jgi:hypothetical protein